MTSRIALSALQQRAQLSGTGRYIQEIFRELPEAAPDFQFLLYTKPDQEHHFETRGSAQLEVLPQCPSSPVMRVGWELLNFSRLLKEDRVELYHGPANFLPPRKVCPYVLTLHDMVYFHNPKRTFALRAKYWQWYIRATWRYADAIVTVSEFSKQQILKYLPVDPGRIHVVYNGVEQRFFQPASSEQRASLRDRHGLDKPYILYIGRLDPDKNVRRLIHAYGMLHKSGLRNYDLVIGGIREYKTSDLPTIIAKWGIQDRVRFLGFVEDKELTTLYQEAAAFCYPSLNEGFGLPVIEAMAAGAPVVTSNLSSLPEVIGDTGYTVDPFSVKAIARGLKRALTSDTTALVSAACERAKTFTWRRSAEQTAAVYREILGKA